MIGVILSRGVTMGKKLLGEIGLRLAAARKKAGYTQEELGDKVGLSFKTICSAENGHTALRPENIVNICDCLSISTDFLLKGEDLALESLAASGRISSLTAKQKVALQRIVDDFLSAFE